VTPRKEDEDGLGKDVAIRDVEVVFEGGDVDVAVELESRR